MLEVDVISAFFFFFFFFFRGGGGGGGGAGSFVWGLLEVDGVFGVGWRFMVFFCYGFSRKHGLARSNARERHWHGAMLMRVT